MGYSRGSVSPTARRGFAAAASAATPVAVASPTSKGYLSASGPPSAAKSSRSLFATLSAADSSLSDADSERAAAEVAAAKAMQVFFGQVV